MDAARLKEQFELRVREQIRGHSKLLYYPRRFAELVERDGAFIAADHVFNEGMVEGMPRQAGFERAREADRLDLTVEWLVWAEPRWQPLFSAPQLRYLKQLAEDLDFPKQARWIVGASCIPSTRGREQVRVGWPRNGASRWRRGHSLGRHPVWWRQPALAP